MLPVKPVKRSRSAAADQGLAPALLVGQQLEEVRRLIAQLVCRRVARSRRAVLALFRCVLKHIDADFVDQRPELSIDLLLELLSRHEDMAQRWEFCTDDRLDIAEAFLEVMKRALSQLAQKAVNQLPPRIMRVLGENSHGMLPEVARILIPRLGPSACLQWQDKLRRYRPKKENPYAARQLNDHILTRQILARACRNPDLYACLELQRGIVHARSVGVALAFLEAGRPADALAYLPPPGTPELSFMAGDVEERRPRRQFVEAEIRQALGVESAAQKLRWSCFESSLSLQALRQYLAHEPPQLRAEAEGDAMDLALLFEEPRQAVRFFVEYGRIDLAARCVLNNVDRWTRVDDWRAMSTIAVLSESYPLAATVLLRGLVRFAILPGNHVYKSRIPGLLRKIAALAGQAGLDVGDHWEGVSDAQSFLKNVKMHRVA